METASKALGYSGISGSALTIIASLSQYQLIDRDKGQISISQLAVRILHPTSIKSNAEYLPQDSTTTLPVDDEFESVDQPGDIPFIQPKVASSSGSTTEANVTLVRAAPFVPSTNVLARYSIPLGENEATLVFTGNRLAPEDFDALKEYVDLFKKQFERRQSKDTAQPRLENSESGPGN